MSVDVPVALLGYGTVGSAVARLLAESADDIERATGQKLRVVRALVRDLDKEREFQPADGVLTTNVADICEDGSIAVVAEVMGGVDPTGDHVLDLLRAGKAVTRRTSSSSPGAARSSSRRRPRPACSSASRPASALRSR